MFSPERGIKVRSESVRALWSKMPRSSKNNGSVMSNLNLLVAAVVTVGAIYLAVNASRGNNDPLAPSTIQVREKSESEKKSIDTNQDGKVSRDEWASAHRNDKEFDALDLDGNGVIDVEDKYASAMDTPTDMVFGTLLVAGAVMALGYGSEWIIKWLPFTIGSLFTFANLSAHAGDWWLKMPLDGLGLSISDPLTRVGVSLIVGLLFSVVAAKAIAAVVMFILSWCLSNLLPNGIGNSGPVRLLLSAITSVLAHMFGIAAPGFVGFICRPFMSATLIGLSVEHFFASQQEPHCFSIQLHCGPTSPKFFWPALITLVIALVRISANLWQAGKNLLLPQDRETWAGQKEGSENKTSTHD